MLEAVRTSETSVDNLFTRQYNPEDSSEHHTRRRENLKSHIIPVVKVTVADLAKTCMGVFFIISVSDAIFSAGFLPRLPADRRGPPVIRGSQFH
jgi:hypothetical protein